MRKILIILLVLSCFYSQAQRRTTSVKSYYRKDGTHVKSHNRSYNSASSYTGSYASNESDKGVDSIPYNHLSLVEVSNSDIIKGKSKISNLIKSEKENEGVVFYVSVLRYNGKVIDICPIERDYANRWDFDKVKHVIKKDILKPEEALELVSDYKWSLSKDVLEKSFYKYMNDKLPKFLQKNIEALKVE